MSSEISAGGLLLGYARVSTLEQNEELQRDALTAAGCDPLYVDKASGKLASRPALDAMLDQLRAGDTVVVWRLALHVEAELHDAVGQRHLCGGVKGAAWVVSTGWPGCLGRHRRPSVEHVSDGWRQCVRC